MWPLPLDALFRRRSSLVFGLFIFIHMARAWRSTPFIRAKGAARWYLSPKTENPGRRSLSRTITSVLSTARVTDTSKEDLEAAASFLQRGGLVAFPTETVYGLGGAITQGKALSAIFRTKKRPRSDPLIVHVLNLEDALALYDVDKLTPQAIDVVSVLSSAFWPGPLTIIAKAAVGVAPEITAGTECVGVRCPRHPVARQLLECTRIPLAAPSANRFGHVSPTTAEHVQDDLSDADIIILKPLSVEVADSDSGLTCDVGIESTVVKVHDDGEQVEVLRAGVVGERDLRDALQGFRIEITGRKRELRDPAESSDVASSKGFESPGQFLRHYAPDTPAVLLRLERGAGSRTPEEWVDAVQRGVKGSFETDLGAAVVLDIGGRLLCLREKVTAYMDVGPSGLLEEAAQHLFKGLRWAEQVEGGKLIILPDLCCPPASESSRDAGAVDAALKDALQDRLIRAVSGITVEI